MAFDISEFHARLSNQGGVALTHNYEMLIPSTVGKTGQRYFQLNQSTADNMRFRIDSLTFPGRGASPIEYRTYGPVQRIGGMANYVDLDVTIILSPDYSERRFFLAWQDLVFGGHRRSSNAFNYDQSRKMFDLGYYDDYVCDSIRINTYAEVSKQPIYSLRLIDAFPIRVGDVSMSWNSTEVIKLPVTFSYRYFIDSD